MHSLFLTFDTEDFISDNSISGLHTLLECLHCYDLTGLFFITGHMAGKLRSFPSVLDLLSEHQIGYHGSSHSVHPTLFEFTDVPSYEEAYQTSLVREAAHINPLTGVVEGAGGIYALKDLFPKKEIISFRAPGYCWSPPHLEALKTFGINYDFSTKISINPFNYRGITFYPFIMLPADWHGGFYEHLYLQKIVATRMTSVLSIHPSKMVNKTDWDLIYYSQSNGDKPNPDSFANPIARSPEEVVSIFRRFDFLLKHLKALQTARLLEVTPQLKAANKNFHPTLTDVEKCYDFSIGWAKQYGYSPKFLHDHFIRFFKMNT